MIQKVAEGCDSNFPKSMCGGLENDPSERPFLLHVFPPLILCDSRLPPIPTNGLSSSLLALSIPIFPASQKTEPLSQSSSASGTSAYSIQHNFRKEQAWEGKRMIGSKRRIVSSENYRKKKRGKAEHESGFGLESSFHLLFLQERENLGNWERPPEF